MSDSRASLKILEELEPSANRRGNGRGNGRTDGKQFICRKRSSKASLKTLEELGIISQPATGERTDNNSMQEKSKGIPDNFRGTGTINQPTGERTGNVRGNVRATIQCRKSPRASLTTSEEQEPSDNQPANQPTGERTTYDLRPRSPTFFSCSQWKESETGQLFLFMCFANCDCVMKNWFLPYARKLDNTESLVTTSQLPPDSKEVSIEDSISLVATVSTIVP